MASGDPTIAYPFPDNFYSQIAKKIYTPILMGENAVLLLPPFFGKDHLLHYLRERPMDRKIIFGERASEFLWLYGDIRTAESDESKEWIAQMAYTFPGYGTRIRTLEALTTLIQDACVQESEHFVFSINISEDMRPSAINRFFSLANKILYIHPGKIHFLITMYQAWDDADFFHTILPSYNSLFQHMIRPAHRTDDEILHFIRYRMDVWKHHLPAEAVALLVRESGGIPLFAKSALRIAAREHLTSAEDIGRIVRSHPEYRERVSLFQKALSDNQLTILRAVAEGNPLPANCASATSYLERIGIIEQMPEGYRIRSQALNRQIIRGESLDSVSIMNQAKFTGNERKLFSALYSRKNMILQRSTAATLLWDDPAQGSDWALDKTISRMRKKLALVTPSPGVRLITRKKQGFSIETI